jgi:hypothetical protein
MFVISEKKARTLGQKTIPYDMDLKIYRKSIAQPMDLFLNLCDFHLWGFVR